VLLRYAFPPIPERKHLEEIILSYKPSGIDVVTGNVSLSEPSLLVYCVGRQIHKWLLCHRSGGFDGFITAPK